jgi:hypothetical protein
MRLNDRIMLVGAWGVVVLGLGFGISRISGAPRVEPSVHRLVGEIRHSLATGHEPAPPALPRLRHRDDWGLVTGGQESAKPWSAFVQPELRGTALPPNKVTFFVLPYARFTAKGDLDSATITWTFEVPKRDLLPHEIPKAGAVSRVLIERQVGADEPEIIAEIKDPRATSYLDPGLAGRTEYRYRVLVVGDETLRLAPGQYQVATVTAAPGEAALVKTPSHQRVRLLGGDAGVAIIRWESYNSASRCWAIKTESVLPGQRIGVTGWKLDGLRFYKFTLMAEMTDEMGEKRVLSTKD